MLRDLSAAAAFGGMAVSGQLPVAVLALFAVSLLLALLDRRPFASAPVAGASVLALCAAVCGLFVFELGLDPVIGACSFAGLLAAQRMLSDPSPTTSRQVHLSSLLMISGGAALSGDLLFGAALIVFTALAVLSVTLMVVRESSDPAEQLPRGAALRTAALGVALILIAGVALFVFFPRLSWNVAGHAVRGESSPSTGFSEQVGLGGDGSLKRDLRVAMRVKLDPDPGVEALDAYWVGRRYLDFDGREWRNHERFGDSAANLTLAPGGRRTVLNRIELLPAYGARTLIALDRPILFGGAVVRRPSGSERTELVRSPSGEVRFALSGVSYSYMAYSLEEPDTSLSAKERERALRLPAGLDPRIPALARSLAPDATDPARIATALEAALRKGYRYTLTLPGDQTDPLADFLFVRREGHCEHFATALAILLRTRGIPSRVVSGFYGGERVQDEYVLRGGDAHAWTEAWTGDHWLRLDATPPDARSAQGSVWAERLARMWEHVDAFWRSHVLDYSARDQLQALNRVLPRHRARGPSDPASKGAHALPRRLAGVAVAALGLFALLQLFRRSPAPRHLREAIRLRTQAERLLERHALLAPDAADGLEELAHTLLRDHHPAGPALQALTRRYLEARFGTRALRPGESRALLAALAAALAPRAKAA